VTRALGRKQGLGIHSGAIGDGIADLMEADIVDNRHKEIDPAVTVATMLMGTSRLYRFADRNPAIQIRATSYTHDALVLGNFRRIRVRMHPLPSPRAGGCGSVRVRGRPSCGRGGPCLAVPDAALPARRRRAEGGRATPSLSPSDCSPLFIEKHMSQPGHAGACVPALSYVSVVKCSRNLILNMRER
jgi:hypothetical protein